ncbi:MAG: hypothetical protein GX601_14225 [Anaerolineales bacterium]|nr:hypothetical protein [Anaerolineales bacterium]
MRSETDSARRPPGVPWLMLAVAILVPILKLVVIDRADNPLRHSNLVEGRLAKVDVVADITFGSEFILLGYDALPEAAVSGERFEVRTYWRDSQPSGPDYGVTLHVVDAYGHRWEDVDTRAPRWHRTPPHAGEWPPDQYALIALSVPLQVGAPPGVYALELVAFDRATLAPLTAHDAAGQALGPGLAIGRLVITAPSHPPDPDDLAIESRLDLALGPLVLLDTHPDRSEAAPGDTALLTTLWQTIETPDADLGMHVALVSADGSVATDYALPPAADWHPTTRWNTGDIWRGQHNLRLPAGLESGAYHWALQLCTADGGSCWPDEPLTLPDALTIQAPERRYDVPTLGVQTDVRLADVATLVGADLEPVGPLAAGDTLTVTLVWRAEREMNERYRVFLHLLGQDGSPMVQSDGEPANWSRPTTGWLPSEIVLDVRTLTVPATAPAGEYVLQAGLYRIEEGRLRTEDGADAVRLAAITVSAAP